MQTAFANFTARAQSFSADETLVPEKLDYRTATEDAKLVTGLPTILGPPNGKGTSSFASSEFIPPVWLRNRHLQTIAAALMRRVHFLPAVEEWFISVAGEKNQVRCDCSWQDQPQGKITAVVCHGLGGSSNSPIVIRMAAALWKAGMNIVRYNMRNCGGTEDRCRTLYHSGMHGDMLRVVDELIARRCESIVMVGFSAGGNLVLNAAAALGAGAPRQLRAVASICGAMDVAAAADALHEGANRFYEWRFVRELVNLFHKKARLFPDIFQLIHLHKFHSIREFDNDITGPYSGFRDADDIYSSISSSRWAERIAVPTLVIQSQDDPFIRLLATTRDKLRNNPHITFLETERGGHCGFVSQGRGWWAEEVVEAFFAHVCDNSSPQSLLQTVKTTG